MRKKNHDSLQQNQKKQMTTNRKVFFQFSNITLKQINLMVMLKLKLRNQTFVGFVLKFYNNGEGRGRGRGGGSSDYGGYGGGSSRYNNYQGDGASGHGGIPSNVGNRRCRSYGWIRNCF